MSYAWVFNFDAEFELSRKNYTTPTALLRDLNHHASPVIPKLLAPGDVLLEDADASFIGRAWCPTPRALARMRAAGITPEPCPPVDVLRRVNHRLFAHQLGGGLPGQRYVTTFPDLQGGPWMLKRPLTCAGRGQLRVIDTVDAAWIEASLRTDGLILEPLVTITCERSIHGYIASGTWIIGQPCENGHRAGPHAQMAATAERVAQALVDAGYFGPFGIDAYDYEGGFCALSEINARYTMAYAQGMQ